MSLDQLESLFHLVRQGASVAEIVDRLRPVFERYKLISLGFERGSVFWRARLCGDTPWSSASDMGAPPVEVAGLGRLNDAGAPLLYASLKEETALHEVGVQPPCMVQLIGYRAMRRQMLRLAVVGELMHVHKFV